MTTNDRLNDKYATDSKTFAHLRAADPGLPDYLWKIILGYRPQLSAVQWQAVREFTITNAVQMRPRTYENARRIMCMSGRFAAWVWTVTGTELTIGRVYTQHNISRYLQECMRDKSESHRWGLVRQLGTIAETLTDTATIQRLPAPHLPGRAPFTAAEVGVLHGWAMTLGTQLARQNAWAILGLAGGAGLRTDEIIDTRIGDIHTVDGRVFVTVPGHRARRVPVLHPWDKTLLRSIEGRSNPDEFVFHGYRDKEYRPRVIQIFLTEHPSEVRATVSRLRSSWIITHINNGLPLNVLKDIAGYISAKSLDLHLAHATTPSLDDYLGLIVGDKDLR